MICTAHDNTANKDALRLIISFITELLTQRSKLNEHHRIYAGVRPYKFDVCDKAFIRRSNLKRHHRIHTGVSS